MKRYQFRRTVNCEQRRYEAGDVVTTEQIPADYLGTCLRLGHVVEVVEGDAPPPLDKVEPVKPTLPEIVQQLGGQAAIVTLPPTTLSELSAPAGTASEQNADGSTTETQTDPAEAATETESDGGDAEETAEPAKRGRGGRRK